MKQRNGEQPNFPLGSLVEHALLLHPRQPTRLRSGQSSDSEGLEADRGLAPRPSPLRTEDALPRGGSLVCWAPSLPSSPSTKGKQAHNTCRGRLPGSSLVIQVAAHHVVTQQGPGPRAAQRGLPTFAGRQGHVEAVLHVGRPCQEFLQRRQVEADGAGGVLVIVPNWSEDGKAGRHGIMRLSGTL